MRRTLLPAALAALIAGPLAGQNDWTRWFTLNGAGGGDFLGFAVGRAGDLDGDGLQDVLVGAYGADANGRNSGALYALRGLDGAQLYRLDGEGSGDLLGYAVAALGDYDGDGKDDFAVGAPYFSRGPAGFFAGRVYVVSGADGSLLDYLDGSAAGEAFGAALAGADLDGDGLRDLLVGAVGNAGSRGIVRKYEWSGAGMVAAGTPVTGAVAGEMFGYSIASLGPADRVAGDEFIVGIPFADDGGADSGAVEVFSNARSYATLKIDNTPGAHLGISVTGGFDVSGDGRADLAAGAPDASGGAGQVVVWSGTPGAPVLRTVTGAAGDRFGYSVALLADADFDGKADLAAGAPYAGGTGKAQVLNLNTVGSPEVLLEVPGTASSRMGWSVAGLGDINGSGKESVAAGAPYHTAGAASRSGRTEVWSAPDVNLPPPEISLGSSLVQGTSVSVNVTNVKPGATVYFYAGLSHTPSVSGEGFELDISGPLSGSGPLVAFDVETNVTGGTATGTFAVPPYTPGPGTRIWFEAIEYRNRFIRDSNETSGVIEQAPFTLAMEGQLKVGRQIRQHVTYGNPNNLIYYYLSQDGLGSGQAPNGSWTLGINNPQVWPAGATSTSSSVGEAWSNWWTLPGPTAGVTLWFQAFSWHNNSGRWLWSNIPSGTVAP